VTTSFLRRTVLYRVSQSVSQSVSITTEHLSAHTPLGVTVHSTNFPPQPNHCGHHKIKALYLQHDSYRPLLHTTPRAAVLTSDSASSVDPVKLPSSLQVLRSTPTAELATYGPRHNDEHFPSLLIERARKSKNG